MHWAPRRRQRVQAPDDDVEEDGDEPEAVEPARVQRSFWLWHRSHDWCRGGGGGVAEDVDDMLTVTVTVIAVHGRGGDGRRAPYIQQRTPVRCGRPARASTTPLVAADSRL